MSIPNIGPISKAQLFVCTTCSKSFTRKDYLYRHEKNHAQEKPFKCDQCNLAFTRSDLLNKHFKSKSHQKVINAPTNSSPSLGNSESEKICVDNNISKPSFHKAEKRTYDLLFNSPTSIIMNDPLSNPQESNDFNSEYRTKSIKKLGSSLINRNFNDEKIPAPPPQPSIILPTISNHNNTIPLINSTNVFRSQQQKKSTSDPAIFTSTVNQKHNPDSHNFGSHNNSFLADINNRKDISHGGTEKLHDTTSRIINNDLSWLFNENTPTDNLVWLFSDTSPVENASTSRLIANRPSDSDTLKLMVSYFDSSSTNIDASKSTINNTDIASTMYQNLYNENTNTSINNNKIHMNESTRSQIIVTFSSVSQLNKIPLVRFEEYLDLYWFNFAQTFPIIHQATFNPNAMNIYLLISMIVIGMAHSLDKLEYETSIALNKKFRRTIYDVIEDNTELTLPLMQALILHNFSAKNFGDTQLSRMSQIDHGSNIMYLKFSGFLNNLTEPVVYKTDRLNLSELQDQWDSWIHYESCKRIVFFEFICDTQHLIFSRICSLRTFDIKLELPCSDEVWNCADPHRFFEEYQKQPRGMGARLRLDQSLIPNKEFEYFDTNSKNDQNKNTATNNTSFGVFSEFSNIEYNSSDFFNRNNAGISKGSNRLNLQQFKMVSNWPTFLWSLKSMMTTYKANQKEYPLDCYSLFSRYIILHGLLRISWDMRGQSLLDLGFVSQRKLGDFFKKLENAFLNWKGYFDLHVKLYEKQVQSNRNINEKGHLDKQLIFSLNNYGPTNASWANISFYYTGLFCLYADLPSITIFASEYKNFHAVGKIVYEGMKEIEYEKNKLVIEQWAGSRYGAMALIEACKFLRLVHENEETINTFSHIPQTVYLAALIVWCFEMKRDRSSIEMMNRTREEIEGDKIQLDASKYFDLLGNIHYELSKRDAWKYFSMILDLGNGLNDNNLDGESDGQEFIVRDTFEEFKARQVNTLGVICYVLYLLRNCKWVYSIDLVRQLEDVIITYEKL